MLGGTVDILSWWHLEQVSGVFALDLDVYRIWLRGGHGGAEAGSGGAVADDEAEAPFPACAAVVGGNGHREGGEVVRVVIEDPDAEEVLCIVKGESVGEPGWCLTRMGDGVEKGGERGREDCWSFVSDWERSMFDVSARWGSR